MEILERFKGGSLSETLLVQDGDRSFVRKLVSISENREYGLVRWHSQIRKMQLLNYLIPEYCPPVISTGRDDHRYYFDIPYFDLCKNGYEYLVEGGDPSLLASGVIDVINQMKKIEFGNVDNEFEVYAFEEIIRPLKSVLAGGIDIPGVDWMELAVRIEGLIPQIENTTSDSLSLPVQTLTHGNLTLENILWDEGEGKMILIDPYSETYGESLIGDLSQVYQSCLSGYDHINRQVVDPSEPYPVHEIPKVFSDFTDLIDDYVASEPWIDPKALLVFRGSQFTRMFPFKVEKAPDHAYLFLIHGITLLEEAMQC